MRAAPTILSAAVAGLLLFDRHRRHADAPGTTAAPPTVARRVLGGVLTALVLVAAVTATSQTVRIGDSGARAVWGDSPAAATASAAVPRG